MGSPAKRAANSMRRRATELNQLAELSEENARLKLAQAQHRVELAKLSNEVVCERQARVDLEERLVWISKLSGAGLRPRDLGDSKPR